MEIKEHIRKRFEELMRSGDELKVVNNEYDQVNEDRRQSCVGWLASAQNIVHLVVGSSENPYRLSIDKICDDDHGYVIHKAVGEANAILTALLQDIDSGLLASIEDQTKAVVFDDFLDHAEGYAKQKSHREAGVIAGVVFEDTFRAICRKNNIEEKGEKIDSLIDNLVKKHSSFSQMKAKKAKVAAHVRTKATHAQWDEFDLSDVNTTIEITKELISKYLEK